MPNLHETLLHHLLEAFILLIQVSQQFMAQFGKTKQGFGFLHFYLCVIRCLQ